MRYSGVGRQETIFICFPFSLLPSPHSPHSPRLFKQDLV
ncbi:hypothetical protein C789_1392 [Microcystis aeruginosa FACHB-905 = DIANCHI905]|uniref:Uncharacterized protein n=1 Tax=Microcystis aeruginosa PCC 7806SL TaxID=1903187 RepID=A0AB33BV17_MICA7|nr:hypothetical protein BH695_2677 [Microcystis aeruginosa PCC 7806SL]ELS48821.1 hypothetical protein C789_1392 [Microcystis aeruginosa FACHB-905 = DIANCHI905]